MRLVRQRSGPSRASRSAEPTVSRLPLQVTDVEIVAALGARAAAGGAALYDRYHRHVRRVLIRVLGPRNELSDLVQDVFVTSINTIDRLTDPASLRSWLTSIAVFTAREEIRRRARRKFFLLTAQDDLPEAEAPVSDPEIEEAFQTTYRVLGKMPADERIAFALRFIEGMELAEMACACRVSLATIKRRVQRSRQRFESIAAQYDELADWLERGR
jgi:RNA polymerase sigma-70 factor (ECF subfamily)